MTERVLTGVAASPGTALGEVRRWDRGSEVDETVLPDAARPAAASQALAALAAAAKEIENLATRLRADGRVAEADILDAGAMMGEDPALSAAVEAAALQRGLTAPMAIRVEVEAMAAQLDSVGDAELAERAADVRSLARRAARLASDGPIRTQRAACDAVWIAFDLGPADVVELGDDVRALALADGGVTGHAAIVARGLGLPMVVGIGRELLRLRDGESIIVDGDQGRVVASPDPDHVARVRTQLAEQTDARRRAMSTRDLAAVTRDGRVVRVLANASSVAEVRLALSAGADGVGLLRTELAFLDAQRWPSREEHLRALSPVLSELAGRIATVRLLDFGGDKTPPFLRGAAGRGVQLLLNAADALVAQLAAILEAGNATQLRVIIPMVTEAGQVRAVRAACDQVAGHTLGGAPVLGAMVEVPAAAAMADRIAPEVGLLSIGTNDLTSFQLGVDRAQPGPPLAHHPAVLRLVADTVEAARHAGIPVEVCGEAASDPLAMPLLVGLGVDELSVGSAAVARVRSWVRALDKGEAAAIADRAVEADSAAEVEALARPLRRLLDDAGD